MIRTAMAGLLILFTGCASWTPEGRLVRLVEQDFIEKNECEFVGAVSNRIDYFGDDAYDDLRNKAADIGGNTVIVQRRKNFGISENPHRRSVQVLTRVLQD